MLEFRHVDLLGCGEALTKPGGDLMTAGYIGNATAAVEASMLGNQLVNAARLHGWLKDRHELIVEATKSKSDNLTTPSQPLTATEPIGS